MEGALAYDRFWRMWGLWNFSLSSHYLIKKNTARNDLPCASYIRHRFFQHQNHDPITLNHVINMCHTELGWPLCIFLLPKENYKSFNVLPQKPRVHQSKIWKAGKRLGARQATTLLGWTMNRASYLPTYKKCE